MTAILPAPRTVSVSVSPFPTSTADRSICASKANCPTAPPKEVGTGEGRGVTVRSTAGLPITTSTYSPRGPKKELNGSVVRTGTNACVPILRESTESRPARVGNMAARLSKRRLYLSPLRTTRSGMGRLSTLRSSRQKPSASQESARRLCLS